MRKITKPKDSIPYVLCIPDGEISKGIGEAECLCQKESSCEKGCRCQAKIHNLRKQLCQDKEYNQKTFQSIKVVIDDKEKYYQGYGHPSVLNKLIEIYNKKCAYCEKKVLITKRQLTKIEEKSSKNIEHYRPKSKYWQLGYSWDNILLSCRGCNETKADKFELIKSDTKKIFNYGARVINSNRIHYLVPDYNKYEQPLMLHPEYDDVENGFFEWNIKGEIKPKNENKRAKKTIETCNLNRKALTDERLKFVTKLKKDIPLQRLKSLHKKMKDSKNINTKYMYLGILKKIILPKSKNLTKKDEYWTFRNYLHKKLFKLMVRDMIKAESSGKSIK